MCAPLNGELEIVITNTKDNQGVVQILLFKDKEGFPDSPEKAFKSLSVPVENNQAQITVSDLPDGTYAISTFHDPDADGKMRKGLFGIPKDRYGFSNNASGTMGPPSFEDAAFEITQGKKNQINIKLK
ncbi:DUF2141 domain-containing protein [Pleomorphovibrio marinus]|uniref:DUF2141 domain-containing protein n=1 Tax=Pleomorphovibrio marinus TaxID=2164132 RepID=UPI001E42607E|nr:DUF2141 domain-containing protein [Pleomorphovibrio marinus]